MKRLFNISFILSVLIASLSSCQEEVNPTIPNETEEYVYTFALSDVETKAYLDENVARWESGDQLGVYTDGVNGKTYNRYANIDTDKSPVEFKINCSKALAINDRVYCYYPYNAANSNGDAQNPSSISLSVPTAQTGKMTAMPMVAVPYSMETSAAANTNNPIADINLMNLGGIFQFRIYSSNESYRTETVQSVKFTATSAIAGSFVFDITQVDNLSISGYEDTEITVSTNVAVGASKDEDAAGIVNMVVAPGTYSGSLEVVTSAATYTFALSSAKTVERAHIKPLNVDLANGEREAVIDYVTLPWSWEGGSSAAFTSATGVTASGLGSDYAASNAPYLVKLDSTGDYFIIKTDSSIGIVSIDVKMLGGGNTSSLKIQGSADGTNYTDVQTLTISGAQNSEHTLSTTSAFDPSYRYVKAVFTKGSNVGVGPISISKPDTTPAILANDISGVAAAGVSDAEWSYVVKNFTDDVEVTAVTGCVTEAIADGGELVYSVAPNYSGAAVNGTIVLCSAADNSITKTIAVSQLADKFEVSETSLQLGNPANSSKTFKVTSTYAVTISNPNSAKISISPMQIEAGSENAVVTVTALAQNMSEEDVDAIGNIIITRTTGETDSNKTKSVAVTQDVKPAEGVVSYTLSFPDENSANNKVQNYTSEWTATIGDLSWTISKFNNNNWSGGWSYIKCGNKSSASVCTITTSKPIADMITKVIVTVDSCTSGKITSTKLYVASDSSFETNLQTVSLAVAEGEMTYEVPTAVANSYYKLEYTCEKGSSNGLIQISSVEYTTAAID